MEFWLHSECNLNYKEIAQYSRSEIRRLLDGAKVHNEKQERAQQRGSTPDPEQRQREQEALAEFE